MSPSLLLILTSIISLTLSQRPSNKPAKGQNKGNSNSDSNTPSPVTSTVDTILSAFIKVDYGCPRHRRPWHELDQDERNLYINGYLELSRSGKLSTFTQQHASSESSPQAHNTAAFLPWHRYFLWEMETAVRSLGDEYECFAIPYWDWSYETTQTSDISEMVIMNSGLGKFGNEDNGWCLEDENFGQGHYTPTWRHPDNEEGETCLVRGNCQYNPNNTCIFQTPQQSISIITEWDEYGTDETSSTFNGYRYNLEYGSHGQAHNYIGGSSESASGHLRNLLYSPDDPVFYLLHAFVDYQWALWQDCKDYDLVENTKITEDIYGGTLAPPSGLFRRRGPSRIDDPLIFDVLKEAEWTRLYEFDKDRTPRDMHNISDWGVSYEKGSFFEAAEVETMCEKPINPKWFYDGEFRRRLSREKKEEARLKCKNSPSGRYAVDTFELIKEKYEGKGKHKELVQSWSDMTCEYNQLSMDMPCKRPKYFDDCSDMEILEEYGDIDITLDELLSKRGINECMRSTRREFYDWAKINNNLLGLCRGDYDIFCNKKFLFDKEENVCLAQIERLLDRIQKEDDDEGSILEHLRDRLDNLERRESANAENAVFNMDGNNDYNQMRGSMLYGQTGMNETEKLILSAVLNGLIMTFIIAFLAIGRICFIFYFRDDAVQTSMDDVSKDMINLGDYDNDKKKYGKLSSSDESDEDELDEEEF